jgi:hypothetical protein
MSTPLKPLNHGPALPRTPGRPALLLALAVGLLPLAACEKATEVAAEKMIEAQAKKEGVDAKVQLDNGGTTITATDAQGNTTKIESGMAQITEADLGVPLYPGAQLEGTGSRVTSPDGSLVQALVRSSDPPAKVAAFYRQVLKDRAAGRQMLDMSQPDGSAQLMLGDESGRGGLTLSIGASAEGTEVNIQHIVSGLQKP